MLLYYDKDECLIIVDEYKVYEVTPCHDGVKVTRRPFMESDDFIEGFLSGRGVRRIDDEPVE